MGDKQIIYFRYRLFSKRANTTTILNTATILNTTTVFPTARLGNTKAMAYIIRMCYLHGNIKCVSTVLFELRSTNFNIFVWSWGRGDGVKSQRTKSTKVVRNVLSASP